MRQLLQVLSWRDKLRQTQLPVNGPSRLMITTATAPPTHLKRMTPAHPGGSRMHYIREWAMLRDMRPVDIVRAFAAIADDAEVPNKSTVSRWFAGSVPHEKYLAPLAAILKASEPAALFRNPDEEALLNKIRGRPQNELDLILRTLDAVLDREKA